MRPDGFIPATFTFSRNAQASIAHLKTASVERFGGTVAATSVAWGHFACNDGHTSESVVVGFYGISDMTDVLRESIQTIDGIDIVFFITPRDAGRFSDKQIDFSEARGFFLTEKTTQSAMPSRPTL